MKNAVRLGVGIHPFGRFPGKTFEQMGFEAVDMALRDAGIEFKDIQAVFVGRNYLPITTGIRTIALLGRTTVPVVDIESACASGASCLRIATTAILSGQYDIVLALGVEKMPRGFMDPTKNYELWKCYAGLTQNPMWWAMNARRHMYEYGTTIEQIAKVAYKNHKNGVHNPNALFRKEFTMEEIMSSPLICDPVRLYMICSPDEGAAAAILVNPKLAKRFTTKPITLAACAHRLSPYPLLNTPCVSAYPTGNLSVTTIAAKEAYDQAGIGPEDLSFAVIQDTDAFCEIEHCEQLLFCNEGEGGKLIEEGITEIGGKLPVNTDGGMLSKGEPVGASGMGQIYELVLQLRGKAGPRQVENAKAGLAHVFGSMGHAAVTILKK